MAQVSGTLLANDRRYGVDVRRQIVETLDKAKPTTYDGGAQLVRVGLDDKGHIVATFEVDDETLAKVQAKGGVSMIAMELGATPGGQVVQRTPTGHIKTVVPTDD